MPLNDVQTIEELLKPITPEEPCGPYLKRDPAISRLKDLRKLNEVESGIWKVKREETEADVVKINDSITISEDFLTTQSKDLWVAVYYTEALLKEYGFFGLSHGLQLIESLCDKYWEQLHPGIDEIQGPMRLTTFRLLDNILESKLNITPIVLNGEKSYTAFDVSKKVKGHEPTKVKNEIILSLSKESPENLASFQTAIDSCLQNILSIDARAADLDILLESTEAPSFRSEIESLELILSLIKSAQNPSAVNTNTSSNASANSQIENGNFDSVIDVDGIEGDTSQMSNQALNFPNNPIKSIHDAYSMIEKINEYLVKHDTHSPCPALIRRALEWRKKDMYELYADIFASISRPEELFALLAIKPRPQDQPSPQAGPQPQAGTPPANPQAPYPPAANPGYGSPYGGGAAPGTDYANPYGSTDPAAGGTGSPYGGYNPYGSGGSGGGYGSGGQGGGGYGSGGYGGGY